LGNKNRKVYISIDILINMQNEIINATRSPTLDTVLMVEKTIEKYSGEYNRTELWKKLPRKVMWQTYLVVLDYLENINKIGITRDGTLIYLWNPKLAKKYMNMRGVKY